jgi:hypothetical protein
VNLMVPKMKGWAAGASCEVSSPFPPAQPTDIAPERLRSHGEPRRDPAPVYAEHTFEWLRERKERGRYIATKT